MTCTDQPLLTADLDPVWILLHVLGGHVLVDESVAVGNINDEGRVRGDYGDLTGLSESIKEFGIIQPIVLQRDDSRPILVAGGRRLAALRSLGYTHVSHGKEFVWRDEDLSNPNGRIRIQAMELEENLKRQDLHWSETIIGKLKLLKLMQTVHGAATMGRGQDGFGIRTLAQLLGENPSTTSRDLELAGFIEKHPALAKLPNMADARRKLGVAITVAAMQVMARKSVVPSQAVSRANSVTTVGVDSDDVAVGAGSTPALTPAQDERWTLYSGDFQDNIQNVNDESVDLILTDLPYLIGSGDSSAGHGAGLGGFIDRDIDITKLCSDVAIESYRVLRDNRFAVYFYGMNYHQELYDILTTAGFVVDVYPFIWLRDRSAPPDGFARFAKSYDPAFIASKGTPRFIRPNQSNSISIPSVRGPERLHNAQKPMALMEKFVLDMTTPNCVVLDMFAGSGSTGVAALKNNRKVILFEKEESNCVMIRARLNVI